ncbi:IS110 family transposase [Altererythrobacter sp.]|uniref:IS110 family transposase n=1 Tax=Altererythrobacter sp. TaxID=1872480 RepID=UPI003D012D30
MAHHTEVFIGIDTSKLRNAVAIAEAGRNGKVRYFGEIDTSEAATKKLIASLASKYRKLTFCYEAGPTGYGLQRLIESLGHSCIVAAPSLIPKKAGDRIKTNRRDAEGLARLLRAGELTAVWVPDARHEAMRELARARDTARQDLTRKRQPVSSLLLRMGLHYPGIKTWGARHRSWLANLKLEHAEQRFVLEELLVAERQAGERVGRIEQAIRDALGDWSLRDIVPALMAMRGIDMISAVTILAEIGDLTRFANPRQLMAYLGLVPSERSTGDAVRRGPITKAGNGRARRALVEAAWAYRHPARVGFEKQAAVAAAPRPAREIAWKAQVRLCKRFRALTRNGKKSTVVAIAIARELAAFIWAIAQEVEAAPANTSSL